MVLIRVTHILIDQLSNCNAMLCVWFCQMKGPPTPPCALDMRYIHSRRRRNAQIQETVNRYCRLHEYRLNMVGILMIVLHAFFILSSYADQAAFLYLSASATRSSARTMPRPTMMMSQPCSNMSLWGVLYCWPSASPSFLPSWPGGGSWQPGVMVMKLSWGSVFKLRWAMKPMTKSRWSRAILTVSFW